MMTSRCGGGEHSQRQGCLGESRVDLTRLSQAMWGGRGKEGGNTRYSSLEAKNAKGAGNQNG